MKRQDLFNDPALATALGTYAEWLGHGHSERASLWVKRLRMNQDELTLFQAAPMPTCAPYVAQAVVPAPPRVTNPAGAHHSAHAFDAAAAWQRAGAAAQLNAFTYLPEALAPGGDGYLCGMPFAVKDLMGVAGMPCTGGSASSSAVPCTEDAVAVASMKRQGAVVIGMANLHELAFGASSANPVFGTVVNPAAPERIPGGSSGGSAAAVAAGVVDLALGTDTGGSIRIPAACCGVVGFKPSYDAVSRQGAIDIANSLDHIGPIGRTVLDCARAFAALLDLPAFPGLSDEALTGLKVARLTGYFEAPLDEEVRAARDHLCDRLRGDGAQVFDAAIDGMELAAAIQFITISTEAAAALAERLRLDGDKLGEDVRVRLEMAHFLPGHWYVKAQRLRRQLVDRIEAMFERADVLLCPTLRAPAPRIGVHDVVIGGRSYPLHTAVSNLTLPFSLSGMPAISIPWGRTREGGPIGMQIVGAAGRDWQVLEVAQRLMAMQCTTPEAVPRA